MRGKKGSVLGGILLITGSCVGAGMLALPILTGLAGFFPSLAMFLLAWLFMTCTGLLLVEVNGWFSSRVNLISMAGHSLGKIGRWLSWTLYLFLFYALLVAYISGSGNLFSTTLTTFFSFPLADWIGSIFFVVLFGVVVYLGTASVDLWNRALMVGKIICYFGLIILGVQYLMPSLLVRTEASLAVFSLPLLVTSFGFHNMIPSITSYLHGDIKKVKMTIWGGSTLALVIYLFWEIIVLGIVPMEGEYGILNSLKLDREASQALSGVLGISWLSSFAQGLAFFAILTSFLAQSLALVHFLSDGLKMKNRKHEHRENIWLCTLALLPPLVLSVIYPQLFFRALSFAGGFCAVILFGILPVFMVWKGRKGQSGTYRVFGGKSLLLTILVVSLFILCLEIGSMLGISYLKIH